jgi:hypothetical protein
LFGFLELSRGIRVRVKSGPRQEKGESDENYRDEVRQHKLPSVDLAVE